VTMCSMRASSVAAPTVGGATARPTAHTKRARRTVTEGLRPPPASASYLDGLSSSCTAWNRLLSILPW
jgi:hypothetical protein